MRFMIIRKADKSTEAGVMPSEALLAAMLKYNEELMKAGVLLQGEGLQPSSKGFRVRTNSGKPTVVDGPFTETKELIAGFTMIQVRSREEAVAWASRCPASDNEVIEVRQVQELSDFSDDVKKAAAGFSNQQSKSRPRKKS